MLSLNQIIHDINKSTYKLDTSGVAGLFGGDYAVDALKTVPLYAGRRWAGWYNYPGTVTVAKTFGQMANSRLWDSIFPGPNQSPGTTFNFVGEPGPDYSGSFSGTRFHTGHLGYLAAEECMEFPPKLLQLFREDGSRGRNRSEDLAVVTIISLPPHRHPRVTHVDNITRRIYHFISINPKDDPSIALWAMAPSLVNILACVLCFLVRDTIAASLILLGIVNSGFSSLVLGTATLGIRVPVPSQATLPGDGLMFPGDGSIIVLKGEEADVDMITKGEFELDYSTGILAHQNYHIIGIMSLLLITQFLVQLLLIPLCTFFGQIMFLICLVVAGVYHFYVTVVSHDREKVHRELLFHALSAQTEKWTFGTKVQMTVFICLVLGDGHQDPLKSKPDEVLKSMIPNDTAVWKYWRRKVVKELGRFWKWNSEQGDGLPYKPKIETDAEDETECDEYSQFTEQDTRLLDDLIGDAWCVFNRYPKWRKHESGIGRERDDLAEEDFKATPLLEGSPV